MLLKELRIADLGLRIGRKVEAKHDNAIQDASLRRPSFSMTVCL